MWSDAGGLTIIGRKLRSADLVRSSRAVLSALGSLQVVSAQKLQPPPYVSAATSPKPQHHLRSVRSDWHNTSKPSELDEIIRNQVKPPSRGTFESAPINQVAFRRYARRI